MFHHHTATITPFSDNPDFDFEIRNVLGLAVGGGADPGEVLAAAARPRTLRISKSKSGLSEKGVIVASWWWNIVVSLSPPSTTVPRPAVMSLR